MFNGFCFRDITSDARGSRTIHVARTIWEETWDGLRRRGGGENESAAVWGGRRSDDAEHVKAVYFLDDYAGGERCAGYHRVPVSALTEFFATLHEQRQVIIADIHTHPGDWVGLSALDEENPIEYRVGLPAIVVPRFGLPRPSLSLCGVHIYKGNGRWQTLTGRRKKELFAFT